MERAMTERAEARAMTERAEARARSSALAAEATERQGEGVPRESGFNRSTPVGSTLVDTLNELVADKTLTAAAARKVLSSFDVVFPSILRDADHLLLPDGDNKRRRMVERKIELVGQVSNYTQYHDYWKIDVTDVELQTGDRLRKIDHARLLFTTSETHSRGKQRLVVPYR